jgi:DNA-binding PadR family transcriptional regulator
MIERILRGFIALHILHHAKMEPVSGSFIMQELKRHGYSVSPGTLYPLLHKMEENGLLASYWKREGRKRIRLYEITPDGIKTLEEGKKKLKELCSEILGENE